MKKLTPSSFFFLVCNIPSVQTALNRLWTAFDSILVTWGKSHREAPLFGSHPTVGLSNPFLSH